MKIALILAALLVACGDNTPQLPAWDAPIGTTDAPPFDAIPDSPPPPTDAEACLPGCDLYPDGGTQCIDPCSGRFGTCVAARCVLLPLATGN